MYWRVDWNGWKCHVYYFRLLRTQIINLGYDVDLGPDQFDLYINDADLKLDQQNDLAKLSRALKEAHEEIRKLKEGVRTVTGTQTPKTRLIIEFNPSQNPVFCLLRFVNYLIENSWGSIANYKKPEICIRSSDNFHFRITCAFGFTSRLELSFLTNTSYILEFVRFFKRESLKLKAYRFYLRPFLCTLRKSVWLAGWSTKRRVKYFSTYSLFSVSRKNFLRF